MADSLYPWHASLWQGLAARRRQQQMPAALLLSGSEGLGKEHFARLLAAALLCEHGDGDGMPCGRCRGCQLTRAGSHPDLRVLEPEEEKTVISIDQVRDIIHFLNLTPQYGHYKVVIVTPAELLNVHAANSLLKTLEEPPAGSVLQLVTARPGMLPATIRSRCQNLPFTPPPRDQALAWLAAQPGCGDNSELLLSLANGAPLAALRIADQQALAGRSTQLEALEGLLAGRSDPVAVADSWLKLGHKESLYWLDSWFTDMVRLKAVADPPQLSNPDIRDRLGRLTEAYSLAALVALRSVIVERIRELGSQLNPALAMESLVIQILRNRR